MKATILVLLWLFSHAVFAHSHNDFVNVNESKDWQLKLSDSGTRNWQDNWFLDGLIAQIENTEQGMVFSAGPEAWNDAHHAVLWTKDSFKGDIKIEYDFTKVDDELEMVNILYIQATGVKPMDKDIYAWREQREVPSMKMYFKNMNLLHISYAAFKTRNPQRDADDDYVRARAYPIDHTLPGKAGFDAMKVEPSFYRTGLFQTGKTYKVTAIKEASKLYFNIASEGNKTLYSWDIKPKQMVSEGRIGLRHMYTRTSRYKNFKVYTK